jgi:hypothetical protein
VTLAAGKAARLGSAPNTVGAVVGSSAHNAGWSVSDPPVAVRCLFRSVGIPIVFDAYVQPCEYPNGQGENL